MRSEGQGTNSRDEKPGVIVQASMPTLMPTWATLSELVASLQMVNGLIYALLRTSRYYNTLPRDCTAGIMGSMQSYFVDSVVRRLGGCREIEGLMQAATAQ